MYFEIEIKNRPYANALQKKIKNNFYTVFSYHSKRKTLNIQRNAH